MSEFVPVSHPDDILIWPDGSSCFRSELHQMTHLSDDYVVLRHGSVMWRNELDIQGLP